MYMYCQCVSSLSCHMQGAVDIFGLSALDRLFCFMIVRDVQYFLKYLRRTLMKTPSFIKTLSNFISLLGESETLIGKQDITFIVIRSYSLGMNTCSNYSIYLFVCTGNATKVYPQTVQQCSKLWGPYLECTLRVSPCHYHSPAILHPSIARLHIYIHS